MVSTQSARSTLSVADVFLVPFRRGSCEGFSRHPSESRALASPSELQTLASPWYDSSVVQSSGPTPGVCPSHPRTKSDRNRNEDKKEDH